MSEIDLLLKRRKEIAKKIIDVAERCRNIISKNELDLIADLDVEKSKVDKLKFDLNTLGIELKKVNSEIDILSKESILNAIKNQRWFFFENKQKLIMDKETGILWTDLNYFPYCKKNGEKYNSDFSECKSIVENLEINEYNCWRVPKLNELLEMIEDKTFPFQEGENWYIKNCPYWFVEYNGEIKTKVLVEDGGIENLSAYLLLCNDDILSQNKELFAKNNSYRENQKLQSILELFIGNNLYPIFEDKYINSLYYKIYVEDKELFDKLDGIDLCVKDSEYTNNIFSHKLNYDELIEKYDIDKIDKSIIKYYKAVISWIDELFEILEIFQNENKDFIESINLTGINVLKKYQDSLISNEQEHVFVDKMKNFLKNNFELGMYNVSKSLISYKNQAEAIKNRIQCINEGENGILELALLEQEPRVSFSFLTENTIDMISNEIEKIENLYKDKDFIILAIDLLDKWSDSYKDLKAESRGDLKSSLRKQNIEIDLCIDNYLDEWYSTRLKIEEKFFELIDLATNSSLSIELNKIEIVEKAIQNLNEFKEKIDCFYKNDRIALYEKYDLLPNVEIHEKFDVEIQLYKISLEFEAKLKNIIAYVKNTKNKLVLINWAENLVDLAIYDVLEIIKSDYSEKIPEDVIEEFLNLKIDKNELYSCDADISQDEIENKCKSYTELVFKIRKEIIGKLLGA